MSNLNGGSESQRGWIAHMVTRALRKAGATEVTYEADQTRLVFSFNGAAPAAVSLEPVFAQCLDASADDRKLHIGRFIDLLQTEQPSMSAFEDVAAGLRPVLRPVEVSRQARGGSGDPDGHPTRGIPLLAREFLPLLNEMVVIDHPDRMVYVTPEDVDSWGVTASEVFARARANLTADVSRSPADAEPGPQKLIRFVETGSDYWSSYLLRDGWLAGLAGEVRGQPVAFLPDATGLLVATAEPETIKLMLAQTEQDYLDAERPLSPQAYTVDDAGRVVPFTVPPDDPLWDAVHRSELLFLAREYAEQKAADDDEAEDFIASLMVRELAGGAVRSATTWVQDADAAGLLPRADYVIFFDDSDRFIVPWQVVAAEARLTPEPGWTPDRYRVQNWPPGPVLERLRAAAVTI